MNRESHDLSDLLDTIWLSLRGSIGRGLDFVPLYTILSAILWAFLLFRVFLQEGLQVATGHGSELPKILVKYLFVAGMFAIWPKASNSILAAVKVLATTFYPTLNRLLDIMAGSMAFMEGSQQTTATSQGLVSTVRRILLQPTDGHHQAGKRKSAPATICHRS